MADENQELRRAGLKVTLPRVKILQILENSDYGRQHLSAEDVIARCWMPVRMWAWRRSIAY